MREVFLPGSLDELWRLKASCPLAHVYAGGTDLFVKMNAGLIDPEALICLDRIGELKGISEQGDYLRIGSCVTHTQLIDDPLVQKYLPVLRLAVKQIGSPPIRNMGTIGGNICTASPAGDTLPPLYVLKAKLELRSEDSIRNQYIEDFIVGPGATCLEPGEILSAIWVKKPCGYNRHHFEKVGLRNALACSVVSLAALLCVASDGMVEKVALAWGSVGPTIMTSREVEEALTGGKLTPERLRKAAEFGQESVAPISDLRAHADYRRTVAGNLILRLAADLNLS